jgi:serine/threonine protein kinase
VSFFEPPDGGRRVERTVIRKEPLGPDAQRQMRHEVAILERLRGVEGVAQLLDAPRCPASIVVADVGGTRLADMAKPLAMDDLIELAVELGRAVAGMHRRGVMHRDIAPANIVVSRGGAPCPVDFALATSLAEIRPEFTHHSEIVGTLAYLAPERPGVPAAGDGTALQVVLPLPTDWGHPPKSPAWREPSNPSSPARREEVDAADDEEELP